MSSNEYVAFLGDTRLASGSLPQVTREDVLTRSIAHFRNADEEYGARVAKAVHDKRRSR